MRDYGVGGFGIEFKIVLNKCSYTRETGYSPMEL